MRTFLLFFCLILTGIASSQLSSSLQTVIQLEKSPLISYSQFETIADSVEHYRENRLISANDFVAFGKEKNTLILDSRSKMFYDKKHVKGAVNLPFADFTQSNLEALIPNKSTKILIYCNNNFMEDIMLKIQDPSFVSKASAPIEINIQIKDLEMASEQFKKSYTLALNIPTFINLYGYGYQNIYELKDLIATSNSGELQFEGTDVDPNLSESQLYSAVSSSPLVNYSDLQELIDIVKPHREKRLISLDQFNQMKSDENTAILDMRSKEMYDAKHVKGAIHLEFSEFTQSTLDDLLKDRNKRILIYCNNNFITDLQKNQQDRYFMSKIALKPPAFMTELTLALNIPTYINLYGYGYQNVFELNELVVTSDPRIQFEGTAVK